MENKKKKIFEGVATAIVTPYKNDRVDYSAFERLIERQIEGGIDALVFCGTTGEAPTLSEREKKNILDFAYRTVMGRVPVIFGSGTNSYKSTMHLSEYAAEAGADALLCVTPYYNKGTREGIIRTYLDVCSIGIPVILYNIPSRSGVDVSLEMLSTIASEPNLCAVKECSGVGRICDICNYLGDGYHVYSGNDADFLPSLAVGACGIISVLSNIYPERVKAVYTLFKECKNQEAQKAFFSLCTMTRLLFEETNPAPLKYALSKFSLCENSLRLPLMPINEKLSKKIDLEMKKIAQNI